MQANSLDNQSLDPTSNLLGLTAPYGGDGNRDTDEASNDSPSTTVEPVHFKGYYTSCMEMWADARTVAQYLDIHSEWFRRCASPMAAEPLGDNGYALTIGKFGTLGYEVEPKIGLHLLPQDGEGLYRIETIPVPNYTPPGYTVDFRAVLQLCEETAATHEREQSAVGALGQVTRVEWELHLDVAIQFPRFIHALPQSLIQSTGDRLLNQIVRQVSRRLTHKVQEDFHTSRGLPFPKKGRQYPWSRPHASTVSGEDLG